MKRQIVFVASALMAVALLLAAACVRIPATTTVEAAGASPAPTTSRLLGPSPNHLDGLAPIKLWNEVGLWNATITWNTAIADNAAAAALEQHHYTSSHHHHQQQHVTPPQQHSSTTTHSSSSGVEDCIFQRENNRSYSRGSNPSHFGAYQFDRETWGANGGNPSTWGSASATEQDQVFRNTVNAHGYSAWTPYDGC